MFFVSFIRNSSGQTIIKQRETFKLSLLYTLKVGENLWPSDVTAGDLVST